MELVDAMTVGALTERAAETGREGRENEGKWWGGELGGNGGAAKCIKTSRKELFERYQVWPGGASDTITIIQKRKERKKSELKMASLQNQESAISFALEGFERQQSGENE